MELSIIIVNWNSVDFLKKCIASIKTETHGLNYEIVVIDSGSFDGCDRMLNENFPEVRFIQSEQNLGFARSNNLAFNVSLGRCVLFLNPDTEIVGPAITKMYGCLNALPKAGAVGCRLLNSDRSIQTSCIQSFPNILNQVLDSECLRSRWPKSVLWGMSVLLEDADEPQVIEAISGACIMLERAVFERVGLFSGDYFMYVEDLDLCYKIRKFGHVNYFVADATVIHHGGGSSQEATSNFAVVMMRESMWKFLQKTRGSFYGVLYRLSMFLCAIMRLGVLAGRRQIVRRNPGYKDIYDESIQKWLAVLRWSLHREELINRMTLGY